MAIIGNARNARVVVKTVLQYDDDWEEDAAVFTLLARGRKYEFKAWEYVNSYGGSNTITRLDGVTRVSLGQSTVALPRSAGETYTIELIDNNLKLLKDETQCVFVSDNTYDGAGDWHLDAGTLVSFTALDSGNVPVESVAVSPKNIDIVGIGNTAQLTASVQPADATEKSVTWTSSNPTVASVSASGLVTRNDAGAATITVRTLDGNYTDTASLADYKALISFEVVESNVYFTSVGETAQLTTTFSPWSATHQTVNWTTSDSNVATVSSTGLVTCVSLGNATITATTVDGGFVDTVQVAKRVPVTGITRSSAKDIRLTTIGQTAQISASVQPANANNPTIIYTSSNPAVASVSASGLVTCESVGTAVITATTQDGGHSIKSYVDYENLVPLTLTRTPLPRMEVNASETRFAGQTIFGGTTDVTNMYDYWTVGAQGSSWGYYQTDNGVAHVTDGNYSALSTLLAFDKYQNFSVEVEYRLTSLSESQDSSKLDTALVLYPYENRYAHLPKPNRETAPYLGFVWNNGKINYNLQADTPIPFGDMLNQWIKLRVAYRAAGTACYVTGSVTIGGTTYTATGEQLLAGMADIPNPVIAPTTWLVPNTGRVMYRNLKVLTGSLSAYSFDLTRLSGGEAVNSSRANGGNWTYREDTRDFANGNLVLVPNADALGWVTGTGTLTLPKINVPESSSFNYIEFKTLDNAASTISWALKDANGITKQSGIAENGHNKIVVTAADKTLQPEFTFTGDGTAKLNYVDMAWTPLTPHTLTYDANGGTGSIAPETGVRINTATSGFTRSGYGLAGWNTESDGSGTAYDLGELVLMESDLTLYAVWELHVTHEISASASVNTDTRAQGSLAALVSAQTQAQVSPSVQASITHSLFASAGAMAQAAFTYSEAHLMQASATALTSVSAALSAVNLAWRKVAGASKIWREIRGIEVANSGEENAHNNQL